ncbi:MOSC domain-containing protein [Chloroflexia bacterium SDU3-3]|nr:MOSC domain-containing protein [Chloroflexia bacterium SDU3-3]
MSAYEARGNVIQVSVNPEGGVPKLAVASAMVTSAGVRGDRQRDLVHHGGPDRAVCLYAQERIAALNAEGHGIAPGTTGENLTVQGVDWDAVQLGDRLRIGAGVVLEITGYASPCQNIAGSFSEGAFTRISQKLHPGWSRLYARVLAEGEVRAGDAVAYVPAGA